MEAFREICTAAECKPFHHKSCPIFPIYMDITFLIINETRFSGKQRDQPLLICACGRNSTGAIASRFRQLAEKHENIATGRHFADRERLETIPLGQPTPVGPHSEKRHRKDLTHIDRHFAEAKEHHDKPEYFRRRAAAAESNVVIFSDDPDAAEKLVEKIERLKKRQGLMKRANQLIRKADREGLADLGFSDETIAKLFTRFCRQGWLSELRPHQ
jgi:Domain of unknown function (DUF3560)